MTMAKSTKNKIIMQQGKLLLEYLYVVLLDVVLI